MKGEKNRIRGEKNRTAQELQEMFGMVEKRRESQSPMLLLFPILCLYVPILAEGNKSVYCIHACMQAPTDRFVTKRKYEGINYNYADWAYPSWLTAYVCKNGEQNEEITKFLHFHEIAKDA